MCILEEAYYNFYVFHCQRNDEPKLANILTVQALNNPWGPEIAQAGSQLVQLHGPQSRANSPTFTLDVAREIMIKANSPSGWSHGHKEQWTRELLPEIRIESNQGNSPPPTPTWSHLPRCQPSRAHNRQGPVAVLSASLPLSEYVCIVVLLFVLHLQVLAVNVVSF